MERDRGGQGRVWQGGGVHGLAWPSLAWCGLVLLLVLTLLVVCNSFLDTTHAQHDERSRSAVDAEQVIQRAIERARERVCVCVRCGQTDKIWQTFCICKSCQANEINQTPIKVQDKHKSERKRGRQREEERDGEWG